jgi:integrase/recombinase XerC
MGESAVNGFFSYLALQKRFSLLTAKNYKIDLHQFFSFLDQEVHGWSLNAITHHHIRSFVASLMARGLSPVSVNRKISALRSFFKYLIMNEEVGNNPTQKIKAVKTPKRLPVFIDEDKIGTIFSSRVYAPGFEGTRDKLVLDILYQTGIRRAEIIFFY